MKKNLLAAILGAGTMMCTATYAQTTLYGITDANTIFTMSNVSTPSAISGPYAVSGVASGQTLVGLGSRSGNGALYALGYDSLTNTAQLYTITGSGSSYSASAVGSAATGVTLGSSRYASFNIVSSVDNQIRIVGRNGNNYLMNADNGTITSTGTSGLSFGSGDAHTGSSSSLAATAYTNNFFGSDGTTEIGYDAANNVLVTFDAGNYSNSFNNASNTMHSIVVTTGILLSSGGGSGMDTWYDSTTHTNTIYLTGSTLLSGSHLYSYNMSTGLLGAVSDRGAIGAGTMNVTAISFMRSRGDSTAAISGDLMTALSLNLRHLLTFDAANPNNIRTVRTISGMTSGQNMIAIDYGFNGLLYGLGYNSTSQTYQLYTVDTTTGRVSAVNTTAASLALGTDDGSGNYINAGFRFIPTATNRIRVTGNNGARNVQLDATTGLVVATDTAIGYESGDASFGTTVNLSSIAFTGYNGDTATHMFGFDASTGAMVAFNNTGSGSTGSGSSGSLSTDLSLATTLDLFGHTSGYNNGYMDIAFNNSTSLNNGYMVSNYGGDSTGQGNYSIVYDLNAMLTGYHRGTSATPSRTGNVGYGIPVKDAVIHTPASSASSTGFATYNVHGNDLLVYPNPVENSTRIVLDQSPTSPVNVDVIDMNGQIVRNYTYAAGTYNIDVDMSRLPAGLYSVRVSGDSIADHNLKVVKN